MPGKISLLAEMQHQWDKNIRAKKKKSQAESKANLTNYWGHGVLEFLSNRDTKHRNLCCFLSYWDQFLKGLQELQLHLTKVKYKVPFSSCLTSQFFTHSSTIMQSTYILFSRVRSQYTYMKHEIMFCKLLYSSLTRSKASSLPSSVVTCKSCKTGCYANTNFSSGVHPNCRTSLCIQTGSLQL